jgi:CheY-like chemotaxis protein
VATAPSAEQGLELARANLSELIIFDVRRPRMDGLTAIERFRRVVPTAPVVVITLMAAVLDAQHHGHGAAAAHPLDLHRITLRKS